MDHDVLPPQQPPCKKMKLGCSLPPGTTRMEDLPREIILDVLYRLPVTSLIRFRLVCRSWRSLSQDPLLVDDHLSLTAENGPFLVFHSDYPIRNQLRFVELSAAMASSGIPSPQERAPVVRRFSLPFRDSMPEFDVVGSCNGLLCLSDSFFREPLCVYNPFTGEFRSLPQSRQYTDQEVIFGFGYSHSTRQYKVIKVVYYANSTKTSSSRHPRRIQRMQSDVQVLALGGTEPCPTWRSLGKAPYQIERKQPETFIHGRLHWVTGPRRFRSARQIVSVDLAEERFHEVPKPEGGSLAKGNYQLGVQRGCLTAIVYCNYGRMEIWGMKKYGDRESWVKEYNVRAYVPKGLKQHVNQTIMKIWKNSSGGRVARVLGVLENGEILLEYKSRALVALDPDKGKFRDVVIPGLPSWFHAFVHVGTLCWID
ncbi:hypothetical protein MLD38_019935 [Melastoma candidum]|uniref:Uncharacterized protein n=1 Tax=Melastoma candidum TaxID=119954 RepID=A0ACB9QBL1_9MYRT|nr:hypothetical protein MLD38_019935 [Melastoma candidum]